MVGGSERRLEVGTARTGLHALAVLGNGTEQRKNPGAEPQKIPRYARSTPQKKVGLETTNWLAFRTAIAQNALSDRNFEF